MQHVFAHSLIATGDYYYYSNNYHFALQVDSALAAAVNAGAMQQSNALMPDPLLLDMCPPQGNKSIFWNK